MTSTVRFGLAILAFLACTQLAVAQDDETERRAAAERLVTLTTTDTMTEAMIAAVWPPVRDSIVAQNPSVAPELLEAMQRVMADTARDMVVDMSDDVVAFYAEEFEVAELEGIAAFYASPAGGKLLALTPKLMNQVMAGMLSKTREMLPRMLEEMRKAAEQRGLKLDI